MRIILHIGAYISQKICKCLSKCKNMQNNMQTLNPICIIGLYLHILHIYAPPSLLVSKQRAPDEGVYYLGYPTVLPKVYAAKKGCKPCMIPVSVAQPVPVHRYGGLGRYGHNNRDFQGTSDEVPWNGMTRSPGSP